MPKLRCHINPEKNRDRATLTHSQNLRCCQEMRRHLPAAVKLQRPSTTAPTPLVCSWPPCMQNSWNFNVLQNHDSRLFSFYLNTQDFLHNSSWQKGFREGEGQGNNSGNACLVHPENHMYFWKCFPIQNFIYLFNFLPLYCCFSSETKGSGRGCRVGRRRVRRVGGCCLTLH